MINKIKSYLRTSFAQAAAEKNRSLPPATYNIAIAGAGTAGLAAAAFLKQSGHQVTLFEKHEPLRPIGAGLLLQPTGLAVLSRLGLDKKATEAGSVIYQLSGSVVNGGPVVLDIRYKSLAPHLFGVGIHRGSLFTLLHEKVKDLGVPIITAAEITDSPFENKGTRMLTTKAGSAYGPFDLIVDAQGVHSALRKKFAATQKEAPYPYGALWGVVKNTDGALWEHSLTQKYNKAENMLGILPVGQGQLAFFYSLKQEDYATWRNGNFEDWKKKAASLWPETANILAQFKSHEDLSFAAYSDIALKKFHSEHLVFIGDAAHSNSPQLGQGANMALIDAMTLDMCLKECPSIKTALERHTQKRKEQVHHYQRASRLVTPFFQSDSKALPLLRDAFFGALCKAPYFKTEMLKTLSGIKTGMFSQLNPGDWAKPYDIRQRK